MRITILGGGPAGLYCGLLLKKANPAHDVRIIERNAPDATYGWGVVFSDRTLAAFQEADYKSYKSITSRFVSWDAIDTWYRGELTRCGGHVFAGLSRRALLGRHKSHPQHDAPRPLRRLAARALEWPPDARTRRRRATGRLWRRGSELRRAWSPLCRAAERSA